MESTNFNNIRQNLTGTSPEENNFDTNNINNISLNNNRQTNSNNILPLEEQQTQYYTNIKNNLNLEIDINNRFDNLFERFKSIILDFFINEFNDLVKEENKLSKNNGKFLVNIKGKPDNKNFLKSSFAEIFEKYCIIELDSRCGNENEMVIDLIKKTPFKYIKEKDKETFFAKDIGEKIKKTKTDKCKMILYDMFKKKNFINLIILAEYVEKNYKNRYIRIKNLEEFEKKVKSFEGYENINLELTSKENAKIKERIKILKEFADDPFSYLDALKERKPRNENKK